MANSIMLRIISGEALLFESTLASLRPPDRKTLKAFRVEFFHGRTPELEFPTLGGKASSIYDDADDLIALHDSTELDRLTVFVRDHFGYLFPVGTFIPSTRRNTLRQFAQDDQKQTQGRPPTSQTDIDYASGHKITTFMSYLSTILAAVLLFGAMLSLYAVTSDKLKLGLVALFTILFASSVGLLTNAKKSEIYSATAAYDPPSSAPT